jgi:hypothetical protein
MASNAVVERESTNEAPVRAESNGGGLNIQRIVLIGVAIGIAALAVKQFPDLRRYLKMKSM